MMMQDVILKKLGLKVSGTYEEKYFRLQKFAEYQGITVNELFKLLTKEENPCFIPIRKFGVELEGGIPLQKRDFAALLRQEGIPAEVTGYYHDIVPHFKVGSDSSVSVPDLFPVEITSPQLIGLGNSGSGFKEVEKLLEIWNRELHAAGIESAVNRSCGGHIHVDVYDYSLKDLIQLYLLFYGTWELIKFLIPPSRRKNYRYCRPIGERDFEEFFIGNGYISNRYVALNSANFRDKHVEFRFWPGTTLSRKLKMHLIVSLCFVEAVKKGKTIWQLLQEVEAKGKDRIEIEDLLDFLEIRGEHPVLKEVREYAIKRYYHFWNTAEEDKVEAEIGISLNYVWNSLFKVVETVVLAFLKNLANFEISRFWNEKRLTFPNFRFRENVAVKIWQTLEVRENLFEFYYNRRRRRVRVDLKNLEEESNKVLSIVRDIWTVFYFFEISEKVWEKLVELRNGVEERRINENDDEVEVIENEVDEAEVVDVEERERTAADILEEMLSEGLLTMSA
jgi:hypothetical protein